MDLTGRWAVVTGASSGLGADFAEELAARGCSLVLVARREDRLIALREKLARPGVTIETVAMDLAASDAPTTLFAYLEAKKIRLDYLINNAGFGLEGSFLDAAWEREEAMIRLNICALHHLAKLALRAMLARNQGTILNVASVVAMQPMPHFAAYAATKAYVLHLTEAIRAELLGTKVRICALCPGTTRTEFWQVAGTKLGKARQMGMMESSAVAREGVDFLLGRGTVRIAGWRNRLLMFVAGLLPRQFNARIAARALTAKIRNGRLVTRAPVSKLVNV